MPLWIFLVRSAAMFLPSILWATWFWRSIHTSAVLLPAVCQKEGSHLPHEGVAWLPAHTVLDWWLRLFCAVSLHLESKHGALGRLCIHSPFAFWKEEEQHCLLLALGCI